MIIIKDNVTDDCSYMIDCVDSSVARCIEYHHMLIKQSGLVIVHSAVQKDFPNELCPVHMLALALPPTNSTNSSTSDSNTTSGTGTGTAISADELVTVFDKVKM